MLSYAQFFRFFDYLKVERAFALMYLGHLIIVRSFNNTFRGLYLGGKVYQNSREPSRHRNGARPDISRK
jgi:hypothetical protein